MHKLFTLGISESIDELKKQQLLLLNRLLLVVLVLCAVIIIIDLFFGLYRQVINIFLFGTFVIVPLIYLLRRGYYQITMNLFISVLTTFIAISTVEAIRSGRATDGENILIAVAAAVIFLFEKRTRAIMFLAVVGTLFGLKYYRLVFLELPVDSEALLLGVNYSITVIGLYFFMNTFRNAFKRQIKNSGRLNTRINRQKEELAKAMNLINSMIDNVPLLMVMVDKNGKYTIANKRFESAFGIPKEQLIGRHYADTLPDNILKKHESFIELGLRGKSSEFNEENLLPDGRKVYSHGKYLPILNEKKEVEHLCLFVVDVTELRDQERKLIELNETKDRLFSIVAHDLRSPLNLLQGALFMSKEDDLDKDTWADYIDKVQESLNTMRLTLDNLLIWARTQFDGFNTVKNEFDIRDLVNDSLKEVRVMAQEKHINIDSSMVLSESMLADENQMLIVLRNILNNAIKYTSQGGDIKISPYQTKSFRGLIVEDNGVGMEQELIDDIISDHPVIRTVGKHENGTGLGLTLCKHMLENNGGALSIESAPGKGSKFVISVPKGVGNSVLN
ncbi:MAG: PAS domain-containing sensor histidine kinase [Cyclobacteriaceae bacterium]